MLVLRFVVVVAWSVMLHADVAVVDRQTAGRATHTHKSIGRRADETKGMKKKHTGKRAWNRGMGVDFIFFLFGCCFFFSSFACLRYVVCCIFFCLPYAFVYRPVFGFVCFCVLHMRFFRSFGLFFPFACAALSQRRRQRRDSRARGSIIAACLHVLSLSSSHSLLWPRGRHIPWVCLPAVLLNVN